MASWELGKEVQYVIHKIQPYFNLYLYVVLLKLLDFLTRLNFETAVGATRITDHWLTSRH